MASQFKRNRAPGWHSSDEEDVSSEGEITSSDEDERSNLSKRSRPNTQAPMSNRAINIGVGGQTGTRKVNNIWSDVLTDQQILGGLSATVNVAAGETHVAR